LNHFRRIVGAQEGQTRSDPEFSDVSFHSAFQEQAEGVGQKAVTAQAVGAKAVFELLDAILALPAMVVESEDRGGQVRCS
jgi:hypothetical protein